MFLCVYVIRVCVCVCLYMLMCMWVHVSIVCGRQRLLSGVFLKHPFSETSISLNLEFALIPLDSLCRKPIDPSMSDFPVLGL